MATRLWPSISDKMEGQNWAFQLLEGNFSTFNVLQFAMLKVLKLEARAFKQLECPVPKTGEPFSEPEQCDTKLGSLA